MDVMVVIGIVLAAVAVTMVVVSVITAFVMRKGRRP